MGEGKQKWVVGRGEFMVDLRVEIVNEGVAMGGGKANLGVLWGSEK